MIRNKLALLFVVFFNQSISAAEGKGGMPQLNPESFSSQIFWLILFFFFLFLINHFIFLPKLEKIRSKRDKTIKDYLNEAKNAEKFRNMHKHNQMKCGFQNHTKVTKILANRLEFCAPIPFN